MISLKGQQITPFVVMEILERAQELERRGEEVIHLEIGEPDFETPPLIKEAAFKAMAAGETGYTHSLGLLELREAISEHYYLRYGVSFSPEQVIVTMGTSPAMLLLFAALLDRGDEVILPSPCYPCYANFIRFVDGQPVFVPSREECGFQPRAEEMAGWISPRNKAILINSPANPTGTLLPSEEMEQLAGLGPYIVSDEIYHGMVYQGREHSILELTDRAFVLNGFSKLYAMTGWRLGYLIAPPEFIRPLQKLQQNFFISASAFVQRAGIVALREGKKEVERMLAIYDQRRRYLLERLPRLGFKIAVEPTGAFYILANARVFCQDSYRFALDVLDQAKLAIAPGIDFGANTEGFVRFAYANSIEKIAEGLDRIERYLSSTASLRRA